MSGHIPKGCCNYRHKGSGRVHEGEPTFTGSMMLSLTCQDYPVDTALYEETKDPPTCEHCLRRRKAQREKREKQT